MPEGGGSNDCHLCHIHDHAPSSTLLRTHPLRASQSRSRNPSKASNSTLNRNLHSHHHHHHDGGHHSRENGTIREADAKSLRIASALAKLSERSHSLPGSRGSSISRPNEVSILPNGSPPEHSHRGNDIHSVSRSQREYNNVLAALLDTRAGSLPSSHGASHREPDLLNALPRTHNTSRASTLSRGQLHHSNLTLAQDTEQDYYTHINRSRFKDESRKQRFNIQTVMLIGCYTMLFVVAIIVGVVLCQQNGWLGFGHGSSDEVSGIDHDKDTGTSSMRDLDRSTRGRGNRGNWPGPTIDYDYPSDGQPPRINSAGVFPGGQGRGGNLQNTPGLKDDPLRTVNFQPTGSFERPNGNRRRPVQRVPSSVGGGDTRTRFDQDDSLGVGIGGNQQSNVGNSQGSGKSILDALDESANNGFGGNGQNGRNQNTPRGQSRNNNPFNNFASPGRTGIVNPDSPGRPVLQNVPNNPQRESNQNRAGINNNGARNPNVNRNRGLNPITNGVNNRNVNGGRGNGGPIQEENLGSNDGFLDRPVENFASSNGNQRNQPNRNSDSRVGTSRNSQNNNFNSGTDFGENDNPIVNFAPSGQDSAVNDRSNSNGDILNGNSNTQGGRNSDNSFSSNGRRNFDDGASSNGRGTINDGTNANGRGTFNDGTRSNGRGGLNGDASSNGRGSFNDGPNSNGRGTFNDDGSSNGRGTFNDGMSSNGRGTFNDGMSSNGRGTFNDGTSSNGRDNINDSFNSNGRRNFNSGTSSAGRGNFDAATGTGGSNLDTSLRGGGNFDGGATSGGIGNFDASSRGTSNFGINGGSLGGNTNAGTGTGLPNNFDMSSSSGAGDFQGGSGTRGTKKTNGGSSPSLGNFNSGSGMRGANFDNSGGFEGSENLGPSGTGPVREFDNFQPSGMGDAISGSNVFSNEGTSDAMGNLNSGSGSQGDNFNNGGGSSGFGNSNSGNDMAGISNMNTPIGSRGMSELANGDSSGGRGSSSNNGASGGGDNFNAGSGIGGSTGRNTETSGNFNLGFGGSGPSNINSNQGMESSSMSGGRNNFNLNEATMNQGNSNMQNGAKMNQEPFGAGISTDNFNGGSSGPGNRDSGLRIAGSQSTSNGDFSVGTAGNVNMNFGMGSNNNEQSLGGSTLGSNNNFDIASSILSDGRLPTPIPGMFPQQMRDLGNGDRRRMPSGRNLNLHNLPDNDQSDSILNSQRGGTNSSPVMQVGHSQNGAHSNMNSEMETKSSHTLNTGNVDPMKNMGETAMPTSPHLNTKPIGHNWDGQKAKTNMNGNRNSGPHVMDGVSLPSSGPMSPESQQPTNTFGSGDGTGVALVVDGDQRSGQPTPEIPVTTHQGIITIPPPSGGSTPLKVLKGFTVQRGEVVAISTIKSSDKDISILQPDHDVVFHITPNAPDAGITLIRHPSQDPNTMGDLAATGTTPPRGGASSVLRRWEHTDNDGTLSRGLVRKDGSFAFTNCRPSEVCAKNSGSAGS